MTAVATFHLKRPCGRSSGFCMHCGNAFVTGSCGNVRCENAVSNICLTPGWVGPPVPCSRCKDRISPSAYLIMLYFDGLYPGIHSGGTWGPYIAEAIIAGCSYEGGIPGEFLVNLALASEVPDSSILESAHGLAVSTYPGIGVSYGVALYRNWQNVLTSEEGCRQILYFNYHDPIWLGAGTAIAYPIFYEE